MKEFKTGEIRVLLDQVCRKEISFSRMVEIMNERVSESEVSEFKDGDFVIGLGCIFILHKQIHEYSAQYHVLYAKTNGRLLYRYYKTYSQFGGIDKLRLATEVEKQELLDALAKEGKRWNAEKLCVEDIPKRKFKKGDKVMLKSGCKNASGLSYFREMDEWIGKPITVSEFDQSDFVYEFSDCRYYLHEDWLEPYEELKEGNLAIFWDDVPRCVYQIYILSRFVSKD